MNKFEYTNSSDQVVAYILKRILLFLPIAAIGIACVLVFVKDPTKAIVITCTIPLFIGLILLVNLGYLKTSIYILLGSVNLIATWSCVAGNGSNDIGIVIYPITVLIAVLMLNKAHSIYFLIFTILCISFVALGQKYGIYEPYPVYIGRWPDVIIIATLLLLGLLATSSHANRLKKVLQDQIEEEKRQIELGIKIEESIEEKHQLFREVHHRVKNHMAFINSLIDMEAMNHPNLSVKQIRELQSKIVAVARVHDQLFHSDDFEQVMVQKYLESIISQFLMNYQLADAPISLKIDESTMNVNRIIYLGISVHEIVSLLGKYKDSIEQLEFILTNEDGASQLSVLIEHKEEILLTEQNDKIEFLQFLSQKLNGKLEVIEGQERSFIEVEF